MGSKNDRPITEKQARARRENGTKSRGATTAEGKARSALNATKHGYWARGLRAIDRGPLREDPTEMTAFVGAFVAELDPGDSVILRQAALDVADKAWRLTRAQSWEAEGYSAPDHAPEESANQPEWLRFLASQDRRHAQAVRLFPDPNVSRDDLIGALCSLSFAVGLSEEDLGWVDGADPAVVARALATLIDENVDQEHAALYLEGRAGEREAEAEGLESHSRPAVIRQEVDGSFARNAERLVSQASREYDRSLKRYMDLFERYGRTTSDDPDYDDPDYDDVDLEPERGTDGATDELGIWSRITADEAVDLIMNRRTAESPPRNEPTERITDV